ncbi:phage virion morphogenesis protein [Brucella sp. 10RB9213]|uniref:phage virion morphogenesis protein n=1 Tax=Brucella sp. 10RB9213 TaxID=1844039 RepID=UPI0012AD7B25|nr:phage virion morphogenesis protein [Brucella sp. 10RB9213]MRN67857.1 phage virion morphogenesis protein [Brucella sp. 10RB9213]
MSGVALEIRETGLEAALSLVEGVAHAPRQELSEGIGRLVQEQTRQRIEDEKRSPEGSAWKPNITRTSILYRTGALSRSIDYVATPDSVMIGSALVYARIHQLGGTIRPKTAKALAFMIGNMMRLVQSVTIPARRYLGLSPANQTDIVEAAEDWLKRLVQ